MRSQKLKSQKSQKHFFQNIKAQKKLSLQSLEPLRPPSSTSNTQLLLRLDHNIEQLKQLSHKLGFMIKEVREATQRK